MVLVVHHVGVEHHLDLAGAAHLGDGLRSCQFLRQGQDAGRHNSAGGLRRVEQELLDLGRVLPVHGLQHLFGQVGIQPTNEVGSIVGVHLLHYMCNPLDLQVRDNPLGRLSVTLSEDLGGELQVIDDVEQAPLLGEGKAPKEMGGVGRV